MSKPEEETENEDEMETEEIIIEKHVFDSERTLIVTKNVDREQAIAEYRAANGDEWIQFIPMNENTGVCIVQEHIDLIPGKIVRYNILENGYDIEVMVLIKKYVSGSIEFFQITIP